MTASRTSWKLFVRTFCTQLYPNKITITVIPTYLNYAHNTRQQFSASLDYFVTSLPPYLHQFSTISRGNCIRLTVSAFDSQANQSNQSSIQRELLMPSPEVIDLTLSDDEIQPDPI